ncbi:hypothetical protein [Polymorphospora rubra]|uniref:Uncharacterized protein n=1 Tax=Polymorphospora rubra TaxID=338584 RepID=A0A810N0F9_9ACTN|nr:hypothetical protein [Polymorphospora rubra]BCJ65075.1 hypothetical protein Prubr_20960 [Polymorphospora rubra]
MTRSARSTKANKSAKPTTKASNANVPTAQSRSRFGNILNLTDRATLNTRPAGTSKRGKGASTQPATVAVSATDAPTIPPCHQMSLRMQENRGQVPYWLGPNPPQWCIAHHVVTDEPGIRYHLSGCEDRMIALSLAEPVTFPGDELNGPYYEPFLWLMAEQEQHEIEPRIVVYRDVQPGAPTLNLTLREAALIGTRLDELCEAGSVPLPTEPAPAGAPAWQEYACPAWCAERHDAQCPVGGRDHSSDVYKNPILIDLLLEKPRGRRTPARFELAMYQHYRSSMARINFCKVIGEDSTAYSFELTVVEARQFADYVADLLTLVTGGAA